MLPRPKRLNRAAFGTVARGKRLISAHFSVSVAPAPTGRAAAVVSKNVARKAVDRHQLKRRIFEAVRPYTDAPCALIVYARTGSPALPYSALKAELDELLRSVIPV